MRVKRPPRKEPVGSAAHPTRLTSHQLRLVKAISKVPKGIARNVEAINALRNGLAHAFFPENLRSARPIYRGKDIFTIGGLEDFIADRNELNG